MCWPGEVVWLSELRRGISTISQATELIRAVRACCKLAFVLVKHIGPGEKQLALKHLGSTSFSSSRSATEGWKSVAKEAESAPNMMLKGIVQRLLRLMTTHGGTTWIRGRSGMFGSGGAGMQ
jgi:hypothetical protein